MSRILVINASPMVGGSVTRQLTAYAAWKLVTEDAEADVSFRDIGTDPPAHLNDAMIRAFRAPSDALDPEAAALVAESDALANEVAGADLIILGLPIYNFGSPSVLKAWFDQVVREDKTDRIVDGAPQPIHTGKTAIVLTATGAGLGRFMIGDTAPGTGRRAFVGLTGPIRLKGVCGAAETRAPVKGLLGSADESGRRAAGRRRGQYGRETRHRHRSEPFPPVLMLFLGIFVLNC